MYGSLSGIRTKRRNPEIRTSPISKIKDFEWVPRFLLFASLIIKVKTKSAFDCRLGFLLINTLLVKNYISMIFKIFHNVTN